MLRTARIPRPLFSRAGGIIFSTGLLLVIAYIYSSLSIYELRIDNVPGYRIYCGEKGKTFVLLARGFRFRGVLFSGPRVSKLPRAGEEDTLKGAFRPAEHGRRPLAVESPRPLRANVAEGDVVFWTRAATRGRERSGGLRPPERTPTACCENPLRASDVSSRRLEREFEQPDQSKKPCGRSPGAQVETCAEHPGLCYTPVLPRNFLGGWVCIILLFAHLFCLRISGLGPRSYVIE